MDNAEVGSFHFIDCSSVSVKCEYIPEIKTEESVLLDPLKVENIQIEKNEDGTFQNFDHATNYAQDHFVQSQKIKVEPFDDFGDNNTETKDQTDQDTEPVTSSSAATVDNVSSHESDVYVGEKNDKLSAVPDLVCEDFKRHKCETCHKSFDYKSKLSRHERMHTGEKQCVCKTCGKYFATKDSLVIHERIHTGEKPYVCKTCGKSFMKTDHLAIHDRVHTGEKPYVCKICGKRFSSRSNLVRHVHIHTG